MSKLDNKFLIEAFTENKIKNRYCFLYDTLCGFIKASDYSDILIISSPILNQVVTDYFTDIYRLKKFHEEINFVNQVKIYSYIAYWVCRRKPIQVIKDFNDDTAESLADKEELSFINEKAMTSFIQTLLFQKPSDVAIVSSKREEFSSFIENLLYVLKYRHYNAQNIESMILAFMAGRAYQYSTGESSKFQIEEDKDS